MLAARRRWAPFLLAVEPPAPGQSPLASQTMSTTQPVRVLIVEDDVDSGDALALMLASAGCETLVLRGPDEALAEALRFAPHVALLDLLFLDSTSGLDLARAFRAEPALAGVTLAALSGYADDNERAACREAGFDFHFAKPADPATLVEFVRLAARPGGLVQAGAAVRARALAADAVAAPAG